MTKHASPSFYNQKHDHESLLCYCTYSNLHCLPVSLNYTETASFISDLISCYSFLTSTGYHSSYLALSLYLESSSSSYQVKNPFRKRQEGNIHVPLDAIDEVFLAYLASYDQSRMNCFFSFDSKRTSMCTSLIDSWN